MRKHEKPLTPMQIAAVKDEDVDFSDFPELDDDYWRNAELVEPDRKEQATVRVKRSVLAKRVGEALAALGVSPGFLETRRLPMYADAEQLAVVEVDAAGRELLLTPPTATAWKSMSKRASHDGVELFLVSAFRSFDRQLEIIKRKLIAGQTWEEIFNVSAPPGCSEHHTGRAVDVGTPHCRVLDQEFEQTEAYDWLVRFAGEFGFRLSYPRGNSCGYAYEPWHWCFVKDIPSALRY